MSKIKWIERELEDCIADSPGEFLHQFHKHSEDVRINDDYPGAYVLGRQVPCAYGRIDLILRDGTDLYLIECKAVRASLKEYGQLMRYYDIVHKGVSWATSEILHDSHIAPHMEHSTFAREPIIWTVLVGPSFDHQLLASGANLVTATMGEGGFTFYRPDYDHAQAMREHQANQVLHNLLRPVSEQIAGQVAGRVLVDNLRNVWGKQ